MPERRVSYGMRMVKTNTMASVKNKKRRRKRKTKPPKFLKGSLHDTDLELTIGL